MEKNIYLCGCVKNCAPFLNKTLNHFFPLENYLMNLR